IFGPLSDSVGRRPTYLLTLAIYALANLGMAFNKSNYGVLLLLRALQSLGASASFAISYGIVADVCVPSERGRMMGWVSMALNLGTCVGPIMDALCCLWIHGSFYAVDYILAATVSNIFMHTYQFNTLLIGLAYLPRGIGIITGGYCNGRIMDYNYKATARRHNQPIDRVHGDDLREFPIELARSRGTYYLLLISTSTLIAYGWTARNEKHFSILLILQFIQGFWASASITRCAMAAIGVTSLQPPMDAAGLGWYFTALGIMSAVCGAAAVWCIRRYGMRWRSQRNTNL
ncbi:hypothetical protein ASPNIDRAFT_121887, partial [Aspergillus niger ATCC 1015]